MGKGLGEVGKGLGEVGKGLGEVGKGLGEVGKGLGEVGKGRGRGEKPGGGVGGGQAVMRSRGRRKRREGGARDRWADGPARPRKAWPCRDGVTLRSACAALWGRRAAGCGGKAGKEATVATPGAAMGWREGPAWGGRRDGPQGLLTGRARVP